MKEVVSIELQENVKNQLRDDNEGREHLINELNFRNLAIKNLLVGYHYAEAGQVNNVVLKEDSARFKNDREGSFKVEYETHYFMACSDNRYDSHNSMIIEFEIDMEKNILILKGEGVLERAPDGY
jgi:hypothetical protein